MLGVDQRSPPSRWSEGLDVAPSRGMASWCWALVATDALGVVCTAFLTYWLTGPGAGTSAVTTSGPIGLMEAFTSALICGTCLIYLAFFRTRDPRILGGGHDEYLRVLQAAVATLGTVAVLTVLSEVELRGDYMMLVAGVLAVVLCILRKLCRVALVRQREQGRLLTRAIVVGSAAEARWVLSELDQNPRCGLIGVGVVSKTLTGSALPILSRNYAETCSTAKSVDADVVIIAGGFSSDQVQQLGWQLEHAEIELVVRSPLMGVDLARIQPRAIGRLPFLHVSRPSYHDVRWVQKRCFDVVVSATGLIALAPALLALALVIKLSDRGPALFSQTRVGWHGREFSILKFRTMSVGAHAQQQVLSTEPRVGPLFKMRADPRVTPIGRVLRRYSIDELPQLVNVLRGEMSLVGPRPALPAEVAEYEEFVDRRLLVRPGMTGLWQVSGRSNLGWVEGVQLDLHYVENWNPFLDAMILGRTVTAVLSSRGAY